jgi:5-(carboxyamino)imidazole ribonucleotide synthase
MCWKTMRHCPAAHLCHHFTKGDITDFETVYNFGKGLDAITIEIESVNVEALEKLEAEGVKVYPRPAAIRIIKNKITQKEFYKSKQDTEPRIRGDAKPRRPEKAQGLLTRRA